MPARSAALLRILRNPTLRSEYLPIITPLRWDQWRDALSLAGSLSSFSDVPIGLRDGFRLGVSSSVVTTTSPPNHKSALDNSTFIDEQIGSELKAGCYSLPLDPSEFESLFGAYRSSPLGVAFHATSGKPRLIQNHSFPRNNPLLSSVNSEINSDLFQCDWGSFSDCILRVLNAPPGSEVAIFDVEAAHRRMPVAPEDRTHVCIAWNGKVILDHCCCFGCSSSSSIFGRCADTIRTIYTFHKVDDLLNWADDFIFWRFPITPSPSGPWLYSYDESLIWSVADSLGWPWSKKPGKCIPFASSFKYVGFEWDLVHKTVSLPKQKRLKFLAKLTTWVQGGRVSAKECQSVVGSLNHCSIVAFSSRTHLPSLYRFSSQFKSRHEFAKLSIPKPVLKDIEWWRTILSNPSSCTLPICHRPPPSSCQIHVDASTSWGIGLVIDGRWQAWQLTGNWNSDGRDIGWAEMLAVEMALLTLIAGKLPPATYTIHSDNAGVVGAFSASRSRNSHQNSILRHVFILMRDHDIWLDVHWIPSEENLADGPSRGIFPPLSSQIQTAVSIPPPFVSFLRIPS